MKLDTTKFPERITLQVAHPDSAGWAVLLTFRMRRKNDFDYVAFLDANGSAEICAETILRAFDEERNAFIMDYVDPRVGFTGEITAKVMDQEDLQDALKAFQFYRKHLVYPGGYAEKLQYAIEHPPLSLDCQVSISVEGVA